MFALELQDHSLSTSAVQFAIQDVNAAATAAENNAFEKVCRHSINILMMMMIIIIIVIIIIIIITADYCLSWLIAL